MIIVSDKIIRFFSRVLGMKGQIIGLALWPFIIVSKSTWIDDRLINHERIHLRQQIEMLIIPFYIWYVIALYRKGYENISFEKEAYANENNLDYLKKRPIFNFLRYL